MTDMGAMVSKMASDSLSQTVASILTELTQIASDPMPVEAQELLHRAKRCVNDALAYVDRWECGEIVVPERR
jgi:hypothetical protein